MQRLLPVLFSQQKEYSFECKEAIYADAKREPDGAKLLEKGLYSINPPKNGVTTMADAVPIRKLSSVFDEIEDMQDRIMRRAYGIFERNGSILRQDLENWTQAEQELVWRPPFELRGEGWKVPA